MKLFDTHFHLDLVKDPPSLISKIESLKIYTVAVTNLPSLFLHTTHLTEQCKYIRAALGFHPELVYQYRNEIDTFKKLLSKTKYIGEVGLDNNKKSIDDFNVQKEVFKRILDMCGSDGNKILTIHSRRAENEVIDMIGNNFPGKIILHWYTGSIKNIEKALYNGYYFSINYPMTQSKAGRQIIDTIPVDRLLLETDGPFTKFNNEYCWPANTENIVSEICIVKRLSNEKNLGVDIFENFKLLIS